MAGKVRWIGYGLIGALLAGSVAFQGWQFYRFVTAGGRFTDRDGQALCERVAVLEQHSIGFRASGIAPPSCSYLVNEE